MNNLEVRTQEELDEALKDPNVWPILVGSGEFIVSDSAQVTASDSAQVTASGSAQVTASDSAQVTAYGSAQVTAYDSAQVTAYDSAQVTAYGSAQVTAYDSAQVTAYDSAQVTAYDSAQVTAYDSAQVTAYDSAQVTAYGSAQVTAYGSAQVRASGSAQVKASKKVAVTKHGKRVKVNGGVQIEYSAPADVAEWIEEYGVEVKDGVAILYKAVGSDFKSERGGDYTPGNAPISDKWDMHECSHGLHFCGTPHHALKFYRNAKRFVGCPVRVDSLLYFPNGYPTKVKAPQVEDPGCFEVDINGKRVQA